MNITDVITTAIIEMLNNQNGIAQIQRNEMAQKLGCVPSQINYVISSRFTLDQGYIVESRRGGGGFIRIVRLNHDKNGMFLHIINSVGSSIDESSARIILDNLCCDNLLQENYAKMIMSAINDNVLKGIPYSYRNSLRATIFKSMLLNYLYL